MDVGIKPDSAVMARALGLIYIAGPSIAVLTLLLPHSGRTNETGIWILIGLAYAVVPILFGAYRYLPLWAFDVIIAFANLLVMACVLFDQEVTSEYAFFFLWPVPYAFVFFGLPRALVQLGLVAFEYGVALAVVYDRHPDTPVWNYWLMCVAAVAATALLVRALARALVANHIAQAEAARQRALEINDMVLQGIVVARTAHQNHLDEETDRALVDTMEKARAIVTDLLGDQVLPGDLRITDPSASGPSPRSAESPAAGEP